MAGEQIAGREENLRRAARVAGIAGIASFVFLMAGQGLIQIGGMEPAFGAPKGEILAYFQARDPGLYRAGAYLMVLSLLAFLWFSGALWAQLQRAEGAPAWRSMVMLGSGILFPASLTDGWSLAMFRIEEGLDPELARFAFDLGNYGFATSWIFLGSFALAASWVIVETEVVARWLGWAGLAIGAMLLLARIIWTSPLAFAPYGFFWIWVLALCVIMLWRSAGSRSRDPAPSSQEAVDHRAN